MTGPMTEATARGYSLLETPVGGGRGQVSLGGWGEVPNCFEQGCSFWPKDGSEAVPRKSRWERKIILQKRPMGGFPRGWAYTW